MKIHVTGATGFIGQHFVTEALRRGHEIVALVRRADPAVTNVCQVEVGDIAAITDWADAVEGADAVVHLAARVHMMHESSSDLEAVYERMNVAPTVSLANAAADAGVRRFVFMSSIKVNGERTTDGPFSRASRPAPVDPYGKSKLSAEQKLAAIAEERNLSVAILRPTVVYGRGVGGNIRRIGQAVRRGLPLPLGSIRNARTMLAVENLVTGILAALEADIKTSQVFLLGDVKPLSTRELVTCLASGLGVKPRLVSVPTGLLKFGARLFGRGDDVARLVEDLVITPDWQELGISEEALRPAEIAMRDLGRFLGAGMSQEVRVAR